MAATLSLTIADFNSKFSQRYGAITSEEFQRFIAVSDGEDKFPQLAAFHTMPSQHLVIFYIGNGHPSLQPVYSLMNLIVPPSSTCLVCYKTEKGETDVFELTAQ